MIGLNNFIKRAFAKYCKTTIEKITQEEIKKTFSKQYRENVESIRQEELFNILCRLFPESCSYELFIKFCSISRHIDKNIQGRYCGSLEDRLIQMMATYDAALRNKNIEGVCHVDIGVLFGGSLIAHLEVLKLMGLQQLVVGIDPFKGFYGKKEEPLTGLPITEDTVFKNIQTCKHDKIFVKIIPEYSESKNALKELQGRKVITLMIDGDHSYEGVKKDWELYSPLVVPGGYVIFDDYKMMFHFFTVTRFIMDLLHTRPDGWRVVGALDTTLVLQRLEDGEEFKITGGF